MCKKNGPAWGAIFSIWSCCGLIAPSFGAGDPDAVSPLGDPDGTTIAVAVATPVGVDHDTRSARPADSDVHILGVGQVGRRWHRRKQCGRGRPSNNNHSHRGFLSVVDHWFVNEEPTSLVPVAPRVARKTEPGFRRCNIESM